jgi:nucleoside-diphosphate-sugar epimerase
MTIWITGSSGFIGSHLRKRFPKRNTVCIPHETLGDMEALTTLAKEQPPTSIYHFASYGNMAGQKDIQMMFDSNVLYLFNLLRATKDIPYKVFINCSTSSVYGDKKHPMHETNSLEGKDPYAITKQCGELLVKLFVELYDKPIVNIRPFSVYGEGEASFRFIPTVIRCIIKNKPMKLAPGMHDWIYIEDFIEGVMAVQENIKDVKGLAVNIGTGQQYDNYDVVKYLCMLSGKNINKLPITYINSLRSKESWVADNSLLHRLGWVQKYSLIDGLTKLWK